MVLVDSYAWLNCSDSALNLPATSIPSTNVSIAVMFRRP